MAKFTHYLVTRFNVPVGEWHQDKSGNTTLDREWMEHRLRLFAKYCVPTVKSQTDKNFHWIIYIDEYTPANVVDAIHDNTEGVKREIKKVKNLPGLLDDLRSVMASLDTPFVITSRLDNDDGLGKNFIQTVHRHFMEEDKLLLNQTGGIVYDEHEHILTRTNSRNNHFTSLIEKVNPGTIPLTVLGYPHDQPPAGIHVKDIHVKNAWIKIVHERNVKSRMKGKPVFIKNLSAFRGILPIYLRTSMFNTLGYLVKKIISKLA